MPPCSAAHSQAPHGQSGPWALRAHDPQLQSAVCDEQRAQEQSTVCGSVQPAQPQSVACAAVAVTEERVNANAALTTVRRVGGGGVARGRAASVSTCDAQHSDTK